MSNRLSIKIDSVPRKQPSIGTGRKSVVKLGARELLNELKAGTSLKRNMVAPIRFRGMTGVHVRGRTIA